MGGDVVSRCGHTDVLVVDYDQACGQSSSWKVRAIRAAELPGAALLAMLARPEVVSVAAHAFKCIQRNDTAAQQVL